MPNGAYGRMVPRIAMAVAQYRAEHGEWPTHASHSLIGILIDPPGPGSDPDDFVEFRPDLAAAVRARLIVERDSSSQYDLRGPSGGSRGYGLVPAFTPEFYEAYRWLYGEDHPSKRDATST
jgi:hypothetical protein